MKRDIWDHLLTWKKKQNRKPLILKGARQVGKTYILKSFGRKCFTNFHYLNFEKDTRLADIFEKNLDPKRILQEIGFYLNKGINNKEDLIIFDEIQNAPKALTSLKYFHEDLPETSICAAGSLLGLELNEANFPVGKVEFIKLSPMSFMEFLSGIGEIKAYSFLKEYKQGNSIPPVVHSHIWDLLKIYMIVGGLPEVVMTYKELKDDLFKALNEVREKQDQLILGHNADMAKHSGKLNSMQIERLWRNVPAQLAREQDGSAARFRFKGILPGINRYGKLAGCIDWLHTAGLIIKIPITNSGLLPFSAYTSQNSFKLYMFDIGILGALSNLSHKVILDYDYGSYKGYFAENFVAQEFISSGTKELYCWKERQAEVEFLREKDGQVFPVEVKSGWITQAKSLKVFSEKYNPPFRTIFSARNVSIDHTKKVYKYPLYLAYKFPFDT